MSVSGIFLVDILAKNCAYISSLPFIPRVAYTIIIGVGELPNFKTCFVFYNSYFSMAHFYLLGMEKIYVSSYQFCGQKLITVIIFLEDNTDRFEVFTAVTMNNGVFWVVTPCGSCKDRRFGGT
jgi:hypothetical protein